MITKSTISDHGEESHLLLELVPRFARPREDSAVDADVYSEGGRMIQ